MNNCCVNNLNWYKNLEHIPREEDTNVQEDVLCLDCGTSLIKYITEERY
jgi:hypothetical protein